MNLLHGPKTILGYRVDGRPIYPIAGGSESPPELDDNNNPAEVTEPPVSEEPSQGQPLQDTGNEDEKGGNPAWQEFYDVLPTQLHGIVTPLLEKWDKGVQDRFAEINTQYEPYKQYQQYLDSQVQPETIDYALSIMQGLNDDPKKMYDAIGEFYKLQGEQNPSAPVDPDAEFDLNDDGPNDPRVARLEQGVEVMANLLMQEQQAKEQAAEDKRLEAELGTLKEKNGEFDESYVLMYAYQNQTDLQSGIDAYRAMETAIARKVAAPPAPSVLGSGGGAVASNGVDARKLTEKQQKELATQMLENAARQS